MRRRLVLLLVAISATVSLGLGAAAPAGAAAGAPVKVGRDSCGNTQVWVNGQPLFHYLMCMPPEATS